MRNIVNLNLGWEFYKGVEVADLPKEEGVWVDLPHTWNDKDGQDGGNDYFRGICCYVKTFLRKDLPEGEKFYLEIKGANSSAEVYLNGKRLAGHDGGYSTWRVNLTESLLEENTLVVAVDNKANRKVYPQTADFTFYGGLYRSVAIICVPKTHFELDRYGHPGIHVTPVMKGNNAEVTIETMVADPMEGQVLRYSILNAEGEVIALKEDGNFLIENAHLWDGVKNPYLYTAKAEILEGVKILDCVTARFGCRSFQIDAKRGFLLNGREYPLRGVSRHQDRLDIGNALLPEHHREDMDLICEMGANTIRLAHYQHDQYFYTFAMKEEWLCGRRFHTFQVICRRQMRMPFSR